MFVDLVLQNIMNKHIIQLNGAAAMETNCTFLSWKGKSMILVQTESFSQCEQ